MGASLLRVARKDRRRWPTSDPVRAKCLDDIGQTGLKRDHSLSLTDDSPEKSAQKRFHYRIPLLTDCLHGAASGKIFLPAMPVSADAPFASISSDRPIASRVRRGIRRYRLLERSANRFRLARGRGAQAAHQNFAAAAVDA